MPRVSKKTPTGIARALAVLNAGGSQAAAAAEAGVSTSTFSRWCLAIPALRDVVHGSADADADDDTPKAIRIPGFPILYQAEFAEAPPSVRLWIQRALDALHKAGVAP